MTEIEIETLTEEARKVITDRNLPLTPQAVGQALRASGRPVGDSTVLAVFEALKTNEAKPRLHTRETLSTKYDGVAYRWVTVTLVASAYLQVTESERVDKHYPKPEAPHKSQTITDEMTAVACVRAAEVARKRANTLIQALAATREES